MHITAIGYIFVLVVAISQSRQNDMNESVLRFQPFESKYRGLILLNLDDPRRTEQWRNLTDSFLKPYNKDVKNVVACGYDSPPPKGKICKFSIENFDPCTRENNYGYHRGSPCIFLSLEKLLGWIPKTYNSETLPPEAPKNLKEFIRRRETSDGKELVWVSCEGNTAPDKEFLGPLSYYPDRGFPVFYFPYKGDEGYHSPLVAVHIERPKFGVFINMSCTAWAENLSGETRKSASVSIGFMID